MGNHELDRKFFRAKQLAPSLTNETQGNTCAFFPQRKQNFWQERRDHESTLRRIPTQQFQRDLFEATDLQFDVEKCPIPITGENLLQLQKISELT